MKRMLSISLALIAGLFLSADIAFAESFEKEIYSCTLYYTFDFYHCPGGYFLADNDSYCAIYDSLINYSTGNTNAAGSVHCSYMLPEAVVSALKHGDVRVYLENPGLVSNADFSYFSYEFSSPARLSFYLKLKPIVSSYSMNIFSDGLNISLPLVDYRRGRNLYLVSSSFQRGYSLGYFDENNPWTAYPPYIHPSNISYGEFKKGSTLYLSGEEKNALFYILGNRNFRNGEGAALSFYCPIKLRFTVCGDFDISDLEYSKGDAFPSFPETDIIPAAKPKRRIHRIY